MNFLKARFAQIVGYTAVGAAFFAGAVAIHSRMYDRDSNASDRQKITSANSGARSSQRFRGEEALHDYRVDGYHPIEIGDSLNERYTVVRKLGFGVYSTVWLAKDRITEKHVAIKILTGLATRHEKNHELQFLQRVREADPKHPGYGHLVHLLDDFYHEGPHGKHLCLVSEVMGENLLRFSTRFENDRRVPSDLVKPIARQLLLALDYIHSCNIIHTDLKIDNFLTVLEDSEEAIRSEMERTPVESYPTIHLESGVSITYYKTQPIIVPVNVEEIDPERIKVKVGDLGVGCWADKVDEHPTDIIQSPGLRAPEVRLGAGWGKNSDIWMLGLSIYELMMGRPLFRIDIPDVSAFGIIITVFGDLPSDLVLRGKYATENFFPDGTFNVPDIEPKRYPLEYLVAQRQPPLLPEDASLLVSFMYYMLQIRPEDRPSPADLLKHEWLRT